jgi:hypothetical protein
MTSGIEAKGRFGKQDFVYLSDEDVYRCPAGEKLKYHYTNEEDGQQLRRFWINACRDCALKPRCTTGKERRITRWEHEHVLEAVQRRLDKNPQAMRQRSLRHSEDADGCNALLDETPSEGGHRNGAACTRLQSHPCHEHYRHSAADSGNASIAKATKTARIATSASSDLLAKAF